MFLTWFQNLWRCGLPRRSRSPRASVGKYPRGRFFRPHVEVLEGRRLPATIVVNSALDTNLRDDVLTLREAILVANGTLAISSLTAAEQAQVSGPLTNPNTIRFNIPGSGVHTISPTSALPPVTQPLILDGTTQPGSHCNTQAVGDDAVLNIELDGHLAGPDTFGLDIRSANNVVRGLVINRFGFIGLIVNGPRATGNRAECNFIGTDPTGTRSLGNRDGVFFSGGATANLLGGTTPAARNLVSGNQLGGVGIADPGTANNTVQGNYIGTDASGTASLGNGRDAVVIFNGAGGNTIGGTQMGAGNVLSGNYRDGVRIDNVNGNVVQGNYIGTTAAGTGRLPNLGNGVTIELGAGQNTIGGAMGVTPGGPCTGACNVISGNGNSGVFIGGGATANNLVQGNYIGTDVNGTVPLGNGGDGVSLDLALNNTIGGTMAGTGNLISTNAGNGVKISNGATTNLVAGNKIGTDVTGTRSADGGGNPLGNGGDGVLIYLARNNTIGGTTAGARNLISANAGNGAEIANNASGNLVQGNYIGTDVNGTAPLGNRANGVLITTNATYNIIGASTRDGSTNLISANVQNGVAITNNAANNTVAGNYIGTDVNGTAPLGNGFEKVLAYDGVLISGAWNNTIGGNMPDGTGNLISANAKHGVEIAAGASTTNLVEGNTIGTDVNGTAPLGNGGDGVLIADASSNTIGVSLTAGTGNLISANFQHGVEITGNASGNWVQGNTIGTDVNGTAPLGNILDGVYLNANSNTIGTAVGGTGNVISANRRYGVEIALNAANNLVQGNDIGTDVNGTAPLGNTLGGVFVRGSNNSIGGVNAGEGNTIAFNGGVGVAVGGFPTDLATVGNGVLVNGIFTNVFGIDLGNDGVTPNHPVNPTPGPNNWQNYPVLNSVVTSYGTSTTTITMSLHSAVSTRFRIEFFSNPTADPKGYWEGQNYLGFTTVMTDGMGNLGLPPAPPFTVTLPVAVPVGDQCVVATATDPGNNTSEFSLCVPVSSGTGVSGGASSGRLGMVGGAALRSVFASVLSSTNLNTTAAASRSAPRRTVEPGSRSSPGDRFDMDGVLRQRDAMYQAAEAVEPTSDARKQSAMRDGGRLSTLGGERHIEEGALGMLPDDVPDCLALHHAQALADV
jgi:titin